MGDVILVLGGTAEGRGVAQALVDAGKLAVLSLAGRTNKPLTAGPVRSGGFGGVQGLANYLHSEGITTIVDATHPFASGMTTNASAACSQLGIPLIRLARPGWSEHPLAHHWHWVDDHGQAATTARALGERVLLTVGRQHTLDYVPALGEQRVWARVAEPPSGVLPDQWTLLCTRGPFTPEGENALLAEHRIEVVVTKDSGGAMTSAKLQAAADLGAAVVMIRRPALPPGLTEVSSVADVLALLAEDKMQPTKGLGTQL